MRYGWIAVVMFGVCVGALAQDSPREIYDRGLNALMGTGTSRNDIAGFDLITRAAQMDYVPAQVTLGLLYEGSAGIARDYGRAAEWYKKAAEHGDVLAQWLLGRVLVLGYAGDSRDGDQWLAKAAEKGNPFGAYLLALDLDDDKPEDAAPLYRIAAQQGLPYAQYRLGIAYLNGRGIAQDKYEAYVWLMLASTRVRVASAAVSLLEGELGAQKVQEGKTEARHRDDVVRRSVNAGGCTWKGALLEIPTPPPIDVQKFCQEQVEDELTAKQ